eukprot:EC118922.1.p1 GENE.EC118922.1~~EC118922.1.p1  ORF type:complete len:102 (+),score=15.76 EC118922.1:97-402(+)
MGIPVRRGTTAEKAGRTGERSSHVQLRVSNQHGSEVFFKMKRKAPLGLLFDAYCVREKIARVALDFIFRERTLTENDTPEALNMDDVDYVRVRDILVSTDK